MKFTALLAKFGDAVPQSDGGYLALCPAHADSKPSLRLWVGDDRKARVTCRAGCTAYDVVRAAGLSWPDMFGVSGEVATVPVARPELVSGEVLDDLAVYLAGARLTDGADHVAAAEYLERRFGLSTAQSIALGLGYDNDAEHLSGFTWRSDAFLRYPRVVIPFYGFDGIARAVQGRDISGRCPMRWVGLTNPEGRRWASYGYFRGEGGYGVTVLTEGPGDGLTALAMGYDVVIIRGASLAANPELLRELADGLRGSVVVTAGDNDSAGARFNLTLSDGLGPYGVDVRSLAIGGEASDLSAWREADPTQFPRAFHSAVKEARPVAGVDLAGPVHGERAAVDGAPAGGEADADRAVSIVAELAEEYGASDVLNAHALVRFSGGTIKYAAGLGFHVWDGRRWERSDTKVRQAIHVMGAALGKAARALGEDGKELRRAAKGFTLTRNIDSLLKELRAVPAVHVEAAAFDARPDLLSFANGTVDLRTGELRPHAKEDMLTYALELDYVPDAQAPRWLSFLDEVFPENPELVDYVRRLVGYGITGHTSEQCFAVLWGKGANGKSVFSEVLSDIFGPISHTTPFATFEDKGKSGGIPNDIAALRGARLVMASEGESGKPMNESVLKRVTGKDKISARFLNREFFEFRPNFLLLLATNHQPKFRGQDEGLWRRVKMIPFLRYFAPAERDPHLDVKLRAEAEGIAAWAVAAAGEWYRIGLADPPVIVEAVREYRETSDALAGFFPGELVPADEQFRMAGNDAFSAYLDWCEAENLPDRERWRRTTFYSAMWERGVGKSRNAKGVVMVGLRPANESPASGPGIFGKDG